MGDTSNHHIGKRQDKHQSELSGQGCACILLFVLAMLFFCITSCHRVEYITETVHDTISTTKTDTFHHVTKERETFIFRDSVSHTEYMKGDTMFITDTKLIIRDRDSNKNDSVYLSRIDSLYKVLDSKKETVKEVEKPKSKIKEFFKLVAFVAAALFIMWLARRKR